MNRNRLEPRDAGAIIGDLFRIYGRHWWRLWAIVAVMAVISAVWAYVTSYGQLGPVGDERFWPLPLYLLIVPVLVAIVVVPLTYGALIYAVSIQHFKQPSTLGGSYRYAWDRAGGLIGASVLCYLAVLGLVMTFIGIPVAIYLGVRWAFFPQAALLENRSAVESLARSWNLVGGNWWRVFGVLVLLWVVTVAVGLVVWALFLIGSPVVSAVGSAIGSILSTPVVVVGTTLLYYDVRLRKEDYSLETLAGELGIETGAAVG